MNEDLKVTEPATTEPKDNINLDSVLNVVVNHAVETAEVFGDDLSGVFSGENEAAEMNGEEYCGENLPEEEPPKNSGGMILGTAAQKEQERREAIKNNAISYVKGFKPRFQYDPEQDKYIEHQDGRPGAERFGPVVDFSDLEKRAMEEYIDDYRAHNGGKFYQFGDIMNRATMSIIKAGYYEILAEFQRAYNAVNNTHEKLPKTVSSECLWMLMEATGDIFNIKRAMNNRVSIGYYNHTGENAGIWSTDKNDDPDETAKDANLKTITKLGDMLGVKETGYAAKVYNHLKSSLPEVVYTENKNIRPVKNGVVILSDNVKTNFEGRTKWTAENVEFVPYTLDDGSENPDYCERFKSYGFIYKLKGNWNPDAVDPVETYIDNFVCSVDKLILDIAEDGEHKEAAFLAIFQSINSSLRGYSLSHKPLFGDGTLSGNGGGGKDTILDMIKNCIGLDQVFSATIDDICNDNFEMDGIDDDKIFACSSETRSNGSGAGMKCSDTFKILMRREGLNVKAKHKKTKRNIKFTGPFIPAFNGTLKFDTYDEAVLRNCFLIKFEHRFTKKDENGKTHNRDFIRDEYIPRQDVIDYITTKALSLGPISDYDPEAIEIGEKYLTKIIKGKDPVYECLNEWNERVTGDLHSVEWLYTYYEYWRKVNGYQGQYNRTNFMMKLNNWIEDMEPGWKLEHKKEKRLPKDMKEDYYLGILKRKAPDVIGKFIEGETADGKGVWSYWVTSGNAKISGDYLIREKSGIENEPPEMTAEQEAEEFGRYIAALYMAAARRNEPMTPDKEPDFDEWKAKGKEKPLARFYSRSGFPTVRFTTAATEAAITTA